MRQKPTTVATPASDFPRWKANGINEFVGDGQYPACGKRRRPIAVGA